MPLKVLESYLQFLLLTEKYIFYTKITVSQFFFNSVKYYIGLIFLIYPGIYLHSISKKNTSMFEHGFLPLITDHLFGYNTPHPPKMIWHLQTIKVTYPWVCDLNHIALPQENISHYNTRHVSRGGGETKGPEPPLKIEK